MKHAGMGVLIRELEHVESCHGDEQADAFRSLLPALDRLSSKSYVAYTREVRLKAIKMFPVSVYEENDEPIAAHLAAAHERFWIADIPSLKSKFQGLVSLLDTSGIGTPKALVNVFRILGMDDKKLSVVVRKQESYEGDAPTLDRELTSRLQKQVPYILGIVAKDQSPSTEYGKYTMNLKNLEVYQVQTIRIRRYILENDIRLFGKSDEGAVVFREDQLPDNGLQICIKSGLDLPEFLAPLTDQFVEFFGLEQESPMLLSRVLPT
ncbi:hypothetical protein GJ744_001555 [Endocarpon pusillum]|uniref:Uncharacterized protein n=1 Tax=Endocarpon pusillum TaxID=364733 RepID=A0A8H7ABJ0_9EURO|nr:hypothetical protein GJ744_001555 [Endocarpon pusillum]